MSFLRKLLLSNQPEEQLQHNVVYHQWQNLKDVWNNTTKVPAKSIGIERLAKLFLIMTQFFSPGLYVRAIFGAFGKLRKNLGVELYVIFKVFSAYFILKYQLFNLTLCGCFNPFIFWIWWMVLETVFYTANLIFCNDVFAKPHSYKRNMILILIDYIQITLDYASIYLYYNALKSTLNNQNVVVVKSLDAAYFSFISSLTIGYGDITPTDDFGKKLILGHIMIFLLFGVLFINFYSSRIEINPDPDEQ